MSQERQNLKTLHVSLGPYRPPSPRDIAYAGVGISFSDHRFAPGSPEPRPILPSSHVSIDFQHSQHELFLSALSVAADDGPSSDITRRFTWAISRAIPFPSVQYSILSLCRGTLCA